MFPLRKIFAPGRSPDHDEIAYKSVDLQSDDDDQTTPDMSPRTDVARVQKKLNFFRAGFYVSFAFQAFFLVFWMLRNGGESQPHATYRDLEWSGLLGEDWNGLVPNGTSERWKRGASESQLHPSTATKTDRGV